jgi:tight adherence protein B
VRAGDTLPAAVALVAERGPAPLRHAFRALVADHRVSGDFVGALQRLGAAMADPTADRVVATLVIAHRVGGRELGHVLRTLGGFLREDLTVRKEVVARQSWTLVAAKVAAAAPWLVLLLVASRPQGARAYDSLTGMVVLIGGAIATVVGYRLMVALGRLPEEPRVLAHASAAGTESGG